MKTTISFEFDDEDASEDIAASTSGKKLALCLYLVKERIRSEWEKCDEGSEMEKLIDDVNDIVEENIGRIDLYTH